MSSEESESIVSESLAASGRRVAGAGSWALTPCAAYLNGIENWQGSFILKPTPSDRLPAAMPYLPTVPPTGDRVYKCRKPWERFLLKKKQNTVGYHSDRMLA